MKKSTSGFTIVELLIVIVVIAILASISIVAYTGIQQRARDSQRKSDLAQIAKALHIYNIDNGSFIGTGSGCGASGNGAGFFNGVYSGYQRIVDCLMAGGVLQSELKDPVNTPNCTGENVVCRRYMLHSCTSGTYLYASLESEPVGVDGPTNGTCSNSWDTAWGMNYVVKVN